MGETHASEIIHKHSSRFFYAPCHRLFFKVSRFELLIFSSTLGENLARLGFVAFAAIGLIYIETATMATLVVLLIFLLFLVLLIGDFFPRLLAIWNPESSLAFSLPFASFSLPLSPLLFFLSKISRDCAKEKPQRALGRPHGGNERGRCANFALG